MSSQDTRSEKTSSPELFPSYRPQLVGTTTCEQEKTGKSPNFFKNLQWSPDGTSILTSTADNVLHCHILPPGLLEPPQPHALRPYATHQLPEPAYATSFYPSYSLNDSSTCLFLASPRNLPMRLYSTLGGGILGSYPLVSPTTEAFLAPHSLLFASSESNHFFAGSNNMIAVFDISRPGEIPVTVMRTGQKRHSSMRSMKSAMEVGDSLKGIVSALDISSNGVLAAGTFGRQVGLYDNYGHGETIAVLSCGDNNSDTETDGNGVTEVIWDESGRYLCVAERNSDGIGVWDIRVMGKRLAWLKGRNANTSQRMGVALIGAQVWAGGTDGMVRAWRGVGTTEGLVERDWTFDAHGDVVSGIGLHPGGSVLATCSGQRHFEADDRDGTGKETDAARDYAPDNSLKIWEL